MGVNLACLWLFFRSPEPSRRRLDNTSISEQERMNNLSERHRCRRADHRHRVGQPGLRWHQGRTTVAGDLQRADCASLPR